MNSSERIPSGRAPSGRTAGARSRTAGRAHWSALTDWRNWNLPVKLGAVMLVPTVLAIVLGVVVIRGQVATAAGYTGSDQRTALAERVRDAAAQLQLERVYEANSRVPGNVVTDKLQNEQDSRVDAAVAGVRKVFATTGVLDQSGESAWAKASRQLDRLGSVRATAHSPVLVPSTVAGYYTDIITSLIDLERALLSKVGDAEVAGLATATYDLDAAREEVSLQQATVLVGLARNNLLPDETERLRSSNIRYNEAIDDFRSVGGSDLADQFDRVVSGPAVDKHPTLLRDVLISQGETTASGANNVTSSPGAKLGVDASDWNLTSRTMVTRLGQMADTVSADLRQRASSLQEDASNRAGVTAVLLFVTLLAAAAIVVVMARQLLRSMRTLHRTAQAVAAHDLPEAVADIRAGRTVSTEIAPVPVGTEEEIGQLARAFDAVHSVARRLAVEQASMRASYGDVFVNLSRRSQSLVQRQLRLIERLERDEEDPDQLSTLFQLDHLATRMRRNNENLMVLSGSEPGRGSGQQPTALADLLRAGVSEIEHYQRVEVQPPPGVHVVGYAAGDLVRLAAELLDNATAFSAPETQVTVGTHVGSEGQVVIDIVDRGIGMVATDLQQANEVLATAGTDEVPASRRMGLFVVNRLAERHRISVRLYGGDDIEGIRACITIPRGLIAAIDEPAEGLEAPEPEPVVGDPAPEHPVGPTMPEPAEPFGSQYGQQHAARQYDGQQHSGQQYGGEHQHSQQPGQQFGGSQYTNGGSSDPGQLPALPRRARPALPAQDRGESTAALPPVNGFTAPEANSPADTLFTPATQAPADEDPAPATGAAKRDGSETTPIFDEMISAWFVPQSPVSQSPASQPPTSQPSVPQSSVEPKNGNGIAGNGKPGNEKNGAANGTQPAGASALGDDEFDIWSVPQRRAASDPVEQPTGASTADHPGEVPGESTENTGDQGGQWQFAADAGWETARAVSSSEPEDFTSIGLPKRTPRARLVPGSVDDSTGNRDEKQDAAAPAAPRDADDVRNRMNSFQRGLAGGRAHSDENGTNASGNGHGKPDTEGHFRIADAEDGGTRKMYFTVTGAGAAAPVAGPSRTEDSAADWPGGGLAERDVADRDDPGRWTFAADDGWRAVEAVSKSAPDDFTQAGLPRRTPRARLVPGSVGGDPGPSGPRDPENVRSRLGSFQRGIQDGRHSVHGPAQDTLEYGNTQEKE